MLTPTRVLIYISPLYIWFFIMESQPHKEERFLYVIYPLISLCSALSFVTITKVLAYKMENMVYKSFGKIMELVKIIFIFIFIILRAHTLTILSISLFHYNNNNKKKTLWKKLKVFLFPEHLFYLRDVKKSAMRR